MKDQTYWIVKILAIPILVMILLFGYSILFPKELVGMIIFWFIITPSIIVFIPEIFSSKRSHFLESFLGTISIYAIIMFLIYEHYQSDEFKLIMISFLYNIIIVTLREIMRKFITSA